MLEVSGWCCWLSADVLVVNRCAAVHRRSGDQYTATMISLCWWRSPCCASHQQSVLIVSRHVGYHQKSSHDRQTALVVIWYCLRLDNTSDSQPVLEKQHTRSTKGFIHEFLTQHIISPTDRQLQVSSYLLGISLLKISEICLLVVIPRGGATGSIPTPINTRVIQVLSICCVQLF